MKEPRASAQPRTTDKYTIFHAFFEALQDKEKKEKQAYSTLHHLRRRRQT